MLMKPYFAQGLRVKNEEEILLSNGRILRPDRLIFKENEVIIIDYKLAWKTIRTKNKFWNTKLKLKTWAIR